MVLGHFGVGKTSLIRQFVDHSFSDHYEVSIGVNISKKTIPVLENTDLSLILWDIEGTDDLRQLRESYLLGSDALIFVFDVLRASTFENIRHDLSILNQKIKNIPVEVVGNKIDLADPTKVISQLKTFNVPYNFLTSAKTGSKVDELFKRLAKSLLADAKTN